MRHHIVNQTTLPYISHDVRITLLINNCRSFGLFFFLYKNVGPTRMKFFSQNTMITLCLGVDYNIIKDSRMGVGGTWPNVICCWCIGMVTNHLSVELKSVKNHEHNLPKQTTFVYTYNTWIYIRVIFEDYSPPVFSLIVHILLKFGFVEFLCRPNDHTFKFFMLLKEYPLAIQTSIFQMRTAPLVY